MVNMEFKINSQLDQKIIQKLDLINEFNTDYEQIMKNEEKILLSPTKKKYKWELVWRNIIAMIVLHSVAIYSLVLIPYGKAPSFLFIWLLFMLHVLGVQCGAHRLWAHRSYKANFGLRLFLSLCHVMSLQNDLYEWCRDHRVHHKFSDTDADPHNSTRGFFFSHMGWLMLKKNADVKRKGVTVCMDDLKADPIVMFQRRFYIPLVIIFWGYLPTVIPYYFWDESLLLSFIGCVITRYVITLNLTWLVNSWAHIYGTRPYNQRIAPVEATCRHLLFGEGFHNYHHTFPWDYSASELGAGDVFNLATAFINFFHWMGWAWDLKRVNPSMVKKRIQSTGDVQVLYKRNDGQREWFWGIVIMFAIYGSFMAVHYGARFRMSNVFG